MKINIGCGKDFSTGLIGIDIQDYGQQHIINLEKDRLPFEDDSVTYIKSNHSLEHLWDVKNVFNECWRVLKPNCNMEINVPYGFRDKAHNPSHHQTITENWFQWLGDDRKDYGYKRWKIKILKKVNNGAEIYCVLTPDK